MRSLAVAVLAAALALPTSTVEAAPALPALFDLEFCWGDACGASTLELGADGRFTDITFGDEGDWEWDADGRRMTFAFDVGTIYTGRPAGAGCLRGEMVSFYGDLGRWRGCVD